MSQEQLPYLEERKLVKRWSGPIPALVNLAFTLEIGRASCRERV